MKILVAGAGGFIGGHLVNSLLSDGFEVRAIDKKPLGEWFQLNSDAENCENDLANLGECVTVVRDVSQIYNLAADMGGMGFIELHKTECMLSVLINTHLLMAAKKENIERFFFSSSACVYSSLKQMTTDVSSLKESDAYPALPEDGYGWEKLFSERMSRHFLEDFGLETRVARYHNVYGPFGTFDGGREKAPAAICRKVIAAKLSGAQEIEIWGDGEQRRSFMYIEDCIRGTRLVAGGAEPEPVNLGSEELVSINDLVTIVEDIAGMRLRRKYDMSAPQGVRGRNSDNTLLRSRYRWEPEVSLRNGLEQTFRWIYNEMV